MYPGFTLDEYFTKPVVTIPSQKNQTVFYNEIKFQFNDHGYRTMDFDQVPSDYFLVTGCSLTEGHGLEYHETWSWFLSDSVQIPVVNLAKNGSNAQFACQNIKSWIPDHSRPKFVVAQWPNPFRLLTWTNDVATFSMNSDNDSNYNNLLKLSENNFWAPWISSIIDANVHCRRHNIPILNVCLETEDFITGAVINILKNHSIELHLDCKVPGRTWYFDSKAKDGVHHSAWCAKKWAQRILLLVKDFC
jgi:hypothetical protein